MIEALLLVLCAFGLGFSIGGIFWISHYTISHYIAMTKESAARRVTLQSPPDATCEICKRPLDVTHAHWLGEWEGWYTSWNCQDRCGCGVVMEFPFPDKFLVTVVDFEQAGFVIS